MLQCSEAGVSFRGDSEDQYKPRSYSVAGVSLRNDSEDHVRYKSYSCISAKDSKDHAIYWSLNSEAGVYCLDKNIMMHLPNVLSFGTLVLDIQER